MKFLIMATAFFNSHKFSIKARFVAIVSLSLFLFRFLSILWFNISSGYFLRFAQHTKRGADFVTERRSAQYAVLNRLSCLLFSAVGGGRCSTAKFALNPWYSQLTEVVLGCGWVFQVRDYLISGLSLARMLARSPILQTKCQPIYWGVTRRFNQRESSSTNVSI